MKKYSKLITKAEERPTSEIKYHYDTAPGSRFLFLDSNMVEQSSTYVAVRAVQNLVFQEEDYIDKHAHNSDSTFLFLGDNADLSGLCAEVSIGDEEYSVESPSAVFIPKGVSHSCKITKGSGTFVNIVMDGDYNASVYQ